MEQNRGLKKFFGKCMLLLIPIILYCPVCIYTDVFCVFHPNNIRSGTFPQERFLKMRYILDNPGKFDSLIFGSSRTGQVPVEYLQENDSPTWYNMFYQAGMIDEHLNDLRILIKNDFPLRRIIVFFDNSPLTGTMENHLSMPKYKPYSEYIRLGWKFYLPYLVQFDIDGFRARIFGEDYTKYFYENGGWFEHRNDLLPAKKEIDHKSFCTTPYKIPIEIALSYFKDIKGLCEQNGIEVLFVTNPLWKHTYVDACGFGYLDFLRQVAEITPFVNFSCLNEITCDGRNYYEGSHYRPNVGLLMLELLCGNSDRAEEFASSQFGVMVTQDNVDSVITSLQAQLNSL